MNFFRLIGDLSHLASIFILIQKIVKSRSARGISFKTQVLYVVVFLTRYVDLITGPYISVSFLLQSHSSLTIPSSSPSKLIWKSRLSCYVALQHRHESLLHRFLGLYRLPDALQIQTDSRPRN